VAVDGPGQRAVELNVRNDHVGLLVPEFFLSNIRNASNFDAAERAASKYYAQVPFANRYKEN
jgi:hypothetical protein